MLPKVFISSTDSDLKPFRKETWELLKNFDAKVVGMEKFGARSSKPLQTCLDEVASCNLYIGIIGMRYGSIDKKSGKSFTQLEYELAKKKRIEILIYLIDETKALIHPNVIDWEHVTKLQRFKKTLKKNHHIDKFFDENDLTKKLNVRLQDILPLRFRDLRRPRALDCEVTRFTVSGKEWLIIIGYLNGRPIEIYIIKGYESFWLPKWVEKGHVIRVKTHDKFRYDFRFEDKEGYVITIEGLSGRQNNPLRIANNVLSTLITNETSVKTLIEIIPALELHKTINSNSLKKALKKALIPK